MTALQRLLSITPELKEKEQWLRPYYRDIQALGDILFGEGKTTKERKRLLRELYEKWQRQLADLDNHPDSPVKQFLAEACRLTDDQWDGLFHCYANPRIPNTNNWMEQLIAKLKTQEREMARNPKPGARFIRNGPIIAVFVNQHSLPGEEFLATVPLEEFARIRIETRETSRQAGVAMLARSNISKLMERIKTQWNNSQTGSANTEFMHASAVLAS